MKKYLLPNQGKFFKANLHCHSTISDGCLTPEELKELYKGMGYSVLAYTDHDILLSHQDLTDGEFLALNGLEFEMNERRDAEFLDRKSTHICLIALEPDNLKQVCYNREKSYFIGNGAEYKDQIQFYEDEPDYYRNHTCEDVSYVIKMGRERGFFVTYNHPTWSLDDYEDYVGYEHMHAMEIVNYGCLVGGYEEYNPRVYDDMLRAGKQIYCISADDNHNATNDSGGAWVMIKADKLEYRTITKALVDGNFYSSQGPEIQELWIEDGYLHIKTSGVKQIMFCFGTRRNRTVLANEGETICEASVKLSKKQNYVRVTVVDHQGRNANTNAYFIQEEDVQED